MKKRRVPEIDILIGRMQNRIEDYTAIRNTRREPGSTDYTYEDGFYNGFQRAIEMLDEISPQIAYRQKTYTDDVVEALLVVIDEGLESAVCSDEPEKLIQHCQSLLNALRTVLALGE